MVDFLSTQPLINVTQSRGLGISIRKLEKMLEPYSIDWGHRVNLQCIMYTEEME